MYLQLKETIYQKKKKNKPKETKQIGSLDWGPVSQPVEKKDSF